MKRILLLIFISVFIWGNLEAQTYYRDYSLIELVLVARYDATQNIKLATLKGYEKVFEGESGLYSYVSLTNKANTVRSINFLRRKGVANYKTNVKSEYDAIVKSLTGNGYIYTHTQNGSKYYKKNGYTLNVGGYPNDKGEIEYQVNVFLE